MEKVCPICNALAEVDEKCPLCGNRLADGGSLQNYLGSYSPYVESSTIQLDISEHYCVHLLVCENCHYDTRMAWKLIDV
ncbi:MAG: hypothetical protein ABFC84_10960 [Veillonellales bacterium]